MIIAYTDTFSGISGDMFLGALLDAGMPLTLLEKELGRLPSLPTVSLHSQTTLEQGLRATRFSLATGEHASHTSWRSIKNMLSESDLAAAVKERALDIFSRLAEAEARVHGCLPDDVHFHEVGAHDSLVDIIGAALGLHHFGIEELVSSPLPFPSGWVRCAHGELPLPAPAVCELTRDMEIYGVDMREELVTPTGAAIVKSCCRRFGPPPPMHLKTVGYGAGSRTRSDARPNLLRLLIGESRRCGEAQEVEVIETHLDDWQPEGYPYLSERLFAAGALDVALLPMQMKKGRPGFLLRVVCAPSMGWELRKIVLDESSAIGLRFHTEGRWTLPRSNGFLATPLGPLAAKRIITPSGKPVFTPEYEDCRRLAAQHELPLREIYALAARADAAHFQETR